MIRIADFCYRKRRFVLMAWVLVYVGVIVAGSALPAKHRANYQPPGAESTKPYPRPAQRVPPPTAAPRQPRFPVVGLGIEKGFVGDSTLFST